MLFNGWGTSKPPYFLSSYYVRLYPGVVGWGLRCVYQGNKVAFTDSDMWMSSWTNGTASGGPQYGVRAVVYLNESVVPELDTRTN